MGIYAHMRAVSIIFEHYSLASEQLHCLSKIDSVGCLSKLFPKAPTFRNSKTTTSARAFPLIYHKRPARFYKCSRVEFRGGKFPQFPRNQPATPRLQWGQTQRRRAAFHSLAPRHRRRRSTWSCGPPLARGYGVRSRCLSFAPRRRPSGDPAATPIANGLAAR